MKLRRVKIWSRRDGPTIEVSLFDEFGLGFRLSRDHFAINLLFFDIYLSRW